MGAGLCRHGHESTHHRLPHVAGRTSPSPRGGRADFLEYVSPKAQSPQSQQAHRLCRRRFWYSFSHEVFMLAGVPSTMPKKSSTSPVLRSTPSTRGSSLPIPPEVPRSFHGTKPRRAHFLISEFQGTKLALTGSTTRATREASKSNFFSATGSSLLSHAPLARRSNRPYSAKKSLTCRRGTIEVGACDDDRHEILRISVFSGFFTLDIDHCANVQYG